jgi:lactoylglutathione lyase
MSVSTSAAPEAAYQQAIRTGHIGLNVTDLARSRRFYQEAFGFEVVAEAEASGKPFALLGKDGNLVVTLWQQSAAETAFPTDRPGLHHLSFQVDSLEEVEAAQARLKALGAPFVYDDIVTHSEGGSSSAIFFRDPDGIRLEIFAPVGGEGKAAPAGVAPTCGFF